MNEELKIIIKAVNDEAKKSLAEVKKELNGIKSESDKASKTVDAAMKGMAKGAAIAIAGITALIAAMTKLGKDAQQLQKGFDKLNTTFKNAGSTSQQAASTYKELFGFLGDHDKAIETAQSLAQISAEEKEMAQWTDILKGAWAEMGDKLPIEGLAEAANETITVGKVVGPLADALNWAGISEDAFNQALARTNSEAEREVLIRNTLNGLYGNSAKIYNSTAQATIQYNKAQADLNLNMARLSSYLTPLLTSVVSLGNTMLTFLAPAIQTVSIYLTAFIEIIADAIRWVGSFFGMFGSSTSQTQSDVDGYQAAMRKYLNDLQGYFGSTGSGIDKNINKIKELKKQTMGFDELNVVSSPAAAASVGGGGGGSISTGPMPVAPNPADYGIGTENFDMSKLTEEISKAKDYLKGILILAGLVGTALLGWKIGSAISDFKGLFTEIDDIKGVWDQLTDDFEKEWNIPHADNEGAKEAQKALNEANKELDAMKQKWMTIGGTVMMVAGAFLLIWGFSDAWVNGIDWGNFALMLGGIGLIVGGLAMAFGPLAAAIGLIVGGIALLVVGIKDLITNGYSMEAVITIAVGAIAVLIGTVWALNSALLANPITWVVVAIMALVATFVILWNECEGFRNFWIGLWDGIVNAFNATVAWLGQACKDIGQFFVNAWNWIKDVWNGIPGFFSGLWQGIKDAFGSVGSWFKNTFSNAWAAVKNVFSTGGKIFDGIKSGISNVFTTVVNGIIGGINKVVAVPFNAINGLLNKIRNVDILGVKPFTSFWKANPLSIPVIPKLAKGGIATSSILANIGEAGKEAVLPLENNTGWMDTLADRINNRNTPSKIVLMVDGRELGYATINSINGITKQTGTLQLLV